MTMRIGLRHCLVGASAIALLAMSGCGGASVDNNLTYRKAREQTYAYLQRTIDALPEGVSLGLDSDADRPSLARDGMISCSDDAGGSSENTPGAYEVTYWVNGVPNGKQSEYVDRMVRLWKSWGWTAQAGNGAGQTVYNSPDGYGLVAHNANNRPGGVGLSARSACFLNKKGDPQGEDYDEHQPVVIKQTK